MRTCDAAFDLVALVEVFEDFDGGGWVWFSLENVGKSMGARTFRDFVMEIG